MSLLVLSDSDIRAVLSPRQAIDSQRAAYLAVAEGRLSASGVTSARDPADDSLTFAHTGAIAGLTGVTCKFGMQASGNAARGLPSVHAIVTVLRPDTGEPLACLNGTAVTALRTAAGVAAAADVLARPDAGRLGRIRRKAPGSGSPIRWANWGYGIVSPRSRLSAAVSSHRGAARIRNSISERSATCSFSIHPS